MKKNLYLFTNSFPYGRGEKPFVIPELEALSKEFNVTIVSHASSADFNDAEWTSCVPEDVRVFHYEKPSSISIYLSCLGFLFSSAGRRELKDLFNDGFTLTKLRDSLATFANAAAKRRFYQKAGIFDGASTDLFYTFWFNDQNLALAMEKEEKTRLKVVSRIHGYDLYNERYDTCRQPFQRYKKEKTDKIVFLTGIAKRYFEEHFGKFCDASYYEVIALGTKPGENQPLSKNENCMTIVSCSNLVPIKRVELIAEAISLLDELCVNWVHFGDGEGRDALLGYCESRNVEIDWRGHTSNEEIYSYYRDNYVDAFVTTSASEGSPVSVQEALSFGIPIIGTDVGGICEQIDGNGILLPSNPTGAEVAEAIKAIAERSSEEAVMMRGRSKEIWDTLFNSDKNKANLVSLFKDM